MEARLATAQRLCFDTSALIYYLNRAEPHALIVRRLLEDVRYGRRAGFVSVVSESELLVRPLRERTLVDVERARVVLDAQDLHVVEFDRQITRIAAEVRAATGLRLPDAAIVATAIVTDCDGIVGNDERCAARVTQVPYFLLDVVAQGPEA